MPPKSRKRAKNPKDDNGYVDEPPAKKSKASTAAASTWKGKNKAAATKVKDEGSSDPDKQFSSDEEGISTYWEVSPTRRAAFDEYKGTLLFSIREYYADSFGQMRPGKKGISLTIPQLNNLVSFLPYIEDALHYRGEEFKRPDFSIMAKNAKSKGEAKEKLGKSAKEDEDGGEGKKMNFEATSEED